MPETAASMVSGSESRTDEAAAESPADGGASAVVVGGGGGVFAGHSQMLLWLPHASIAVLLVGLITVSFVRFHNKHGHKYRKSQQQRAASGLVSRNAWLDGGQGGGDDDIDGVVGMQVMMRGGGGGVAASSSSSSQADGVLAAAALSSGGPGRDTIGGGDDPVGDAAAASASAAGTDLWDALNAELSQTDDSRAARGAASSSSRPSHPAVTDSGTRALFSVWTLRRGKVGDIVSLPKAISKPAKISTSSSPGDYCSTDECYELLLEKS